MKVIDQSPIRADTQPFDKYKAYIKGVSKFGWNWIADVQAEETIIAGLKHRLDNSFSLIRNVILEGIDIPIPLVLVGGTGIYVLLVSGRAGVFRARGEVWMQMNRKSRKYVPVRRNLIARAQLMTRVVDAYLTFHHRPHPPIQTAILFSDAGAHVDSVRSAVRVVLKDGMENFANSVVQGSVVIKTKEEIMGIVDALAGKVPQPEKATPEPVPAARRKSSPVDKLAKITKKMNLTSRQWIMIGIMAFVQALILIILFIILSVGF